MVLEEITAPFKNFKQPPGSWAEWVKNRAPGHTSWSMVEIDLFKGQVIECYSFSRASWVQLSTGDSIIATLLQLPLKPIHKDQRRKIGPPPSPDEKDHRQVWQPPLVFQGKTIEKASFDAFETVWPKDQSELSGKTVTLYFDRQIQFPLPFWIQVETSHAIGHFRAIDSGRGLNSPYKTIPRRSPQFVGSQQKNDDGITLNIKSPKYYREFELFAVDITGKKKQISPVSYSLLTGDGDALVLKIDQTELDDVLQTNHSYTWLLVPIGHSEAYTETTKPFVWGKS